jgi:hypothetical protein
MMDDIIEDMSKRLDKASQKCWGEFFEKHFKQGNIMTDKINAETEMNIAEVKHFVVTKDVDGNEVRTEVTEESVKKDFSEVI